MLATRFPTCVETDRRCTHEIPSSASLPCRDMGRDPSDAAAYMRVADIAAEEHVPYMHASVSRFWLARPWPGLGLALGWQPRLGEGRVCEASSVTLGSVGDWNCPE